MKKVLSLALTGVVLIGLTACAAAGTASENAASADSKSEVLTGQAEGFGGTITASVTVEDGVITAVEFNAPNETSNVGGAALSEIAEQMVAKNSADIDAVSGATATSKGCMNAVKNAFGLDADTDEETEEAEASADAAQWPTGAEPVEIPADKNIVMATTYGLYTRYENSDQDAAIQATMYWDLDDDSCYAIRFTEPILPWMDRESTGGWAYVEDEFVLEKLGDAKVIVSVPATEYSEAMDCTYAKYIQIGDIVWTGEAGSTAACENAIVYTATINGQETTLFDYCATEEGCEWYVKTVLAQPCYLLTNDTAASSADDENVASVCEVTTKETNGHGVYFWLSPITFPGNIELLKQFAQETNFSYDYYADGGLSQNEDGYWQTMDAVSSATIDEGSTYLDMMKTLYDRIQAGDYVSAK
jgi:uncharacterized protein with FMN-binding domain